MTTCELSESALIELYFYEELAALERERVHVHLAGCPECRQRLEDLHAIRRLLASVPRVQAPPAGDWSGFMAGLEQACDAPVPADRPSTSVAPHRWSRRTWTPVLAVAATVVLVTLAALMAGRLRSPVPAGAPEAITSATPPSSVVVAAAPEDPQRSLMRLSEQHFERSKLVILGLVTRDPQQTAPTDWQYERELAGSLLSDTRLYRQAAQQRGMQDLARIMGDLETVLLETSLSEHADPDSLERVQRLIRKRDLVVKMQLVGSSGI